MTDLSGIDPPRMDWSSADLPSTFRTFRQYCELIFKGPLSAKTEEEHVTYVLLWIGQDGLSIYNTWEMTTAERKLLAPLWDRFDKQVEPKSNFRLNRFHLQKFRQTSSESADDYMIRCRLQAKKCKFRDSREVGERLLEQLIVGVRHKKVQEQLLAKPDSYTLDAAMDLARTHEAMISDIEQLHNDKLTVDYVSRQNNDRRSTHPCAYCGGSHPPKPKNRCPAYGSQCDACGKPNHWKKVCRATGQQEPARFRRSSRPRLLQQRPRSQSRHRGPTAERRPTYRQRDSSHTRVYAVEQSPSLAESFDALTFDIVNVADTRDEVFASLSITLADKPNVPATLKVKVDTGAQGNILPLRIFRRMCPAKLDSEGFPIPGSLLPSEVQLTAYNGTSIRQYGKMTVPCSYNSERIDTEFYVSDSAGPAILGLPSCRRLHLMEMNCEIKSVPNKRVDSTSDLVAAYPDRFEGIGNFSGEFHITVDNSVTPVIHAPRRCSIHLKDEVKDELDNMERLGVISKVTEPTDWVSSLVYSRKSNNKLRICLDPKDLNTAIKRPHYKTPTLDELTHKLAGATVFSKLDARHGYWSVSLDEPSSFLTTFNSPFGRYRFQRLPFGLNLSQDVFQERMDHILENCGGTIGIADDVAVFGKNEADHDANLHNLMKTARQHGLVFNADKCHIKQPRMQFFGLIFDTDGVHPDPGKITAIKQLQAPQDATQLKEFLGIATYMSPFTPNLSQHTAILRDLLKKDSEFVWTPAHESAFQRTKDAICREATLSYFDPAVETVVQVDASSRGLGAVLLQKNKPIAFASKSLSDCERRYVNIEREMLAVVFGCERFHTFVYGKRFTVESDHKPLEMIHMKNLAAAPQRLQRMLLRIQPYDIVIKYRPGKDVAVADLLSRQPSSNKESLKFDMQINHVQFSPHRLQQLRDETDNDDEMLSLKSIIMSGWPETRRQLATQLRPYWPFRDELTVDDGIIMKSDRIVIPLRARSEILAKLHLAHQGVEKTRLRARSCVYWININRDIENMIQRCDICQRELCAQPSEPLMQHEVPSRPWQIVGTDLFSIGRNNYLIIGDYYSKFPFVELIEGRATSDMIVKLTKRIFSEQGVPDRVVSDNGGHFDSQAYKLFAKAWGFEHVTSSPHYPRSNGFVERQVQTIKRTLKKAASARVDTDMAMLILRSTPIDHHLPSPAEMLNARKMRANLPVKILNAHPEKGAISERLFERQRQQKVYHDQGAIAQLTPLVRGQPVRIQHHVTGKWNPATIETVRPEPRSYDVRTASGGVLRRNRVQIRRSHETRPIDADPVSHPDDMPSTAAVEPVERPDEAHDSGKRVRFSTPEAGYQTRSGRLSKPPAKFNL